MSQYAYILVVISLLFLFLVNKYEKEKLQRLLQDQLLKDPAFRATIKEKNPYKAKAKLANFLLYRGFEPDLVYEIVDELYDE